MYLPRFLNLSWPILDFYIDDILLIASSFDECKKQSAITQILEELGFLINKEKSQLLPVTEIQYLGLS